MQQNQFAERAIASTKLRAERESSQDALELMAKKMSLDLEEQRAKAEQAMSLVVDQTSAELTKMSASSQPWRVFSPILGSRFLANT